MAFVLLTAVKSNILQTNSNTFKMGKINFVLLCAFKANKVCALLPQQISQIIIFFLKFPSEKCIIV